jgi:polyhydroxyalkanoate synthesis regulator phasin
MARGSGAGTGVIVALVVSIVCVIGLLTLTFMMYAGKTEAQRERAEAETALDEFVTSNELNNDSAKRIFDKAKQERKSAFAYMNARSQAVSSFVTGSPSASVDEMRSSLQVNESMVVKTVISDLRRQLNSSKNEVLSLERKISDLQQDNSQMQSRVEQAQSASEEQVASVTMTFEDYNQSTEEFQDKVDKAVNDINKSRVSLDRNYRNQLANLRDALIPLIRTTAFSNLALKNFV